MRRATNSAPPLVLAVVPGIMACQLAPLLHPRPAGDAPATTLQLVCGSGGSTAIWVTIASKNEAATNCTSGSSGPSSSRVPQAVAQLAPADVAGPEPIAGSTSVLAALARERPDRPQRSPHRERGAGRHAHR